MSYTPTLPLAKTLDHLAATLAGFAAWTALLDGRAPLSRIVPESSISWAGNQAGAARAWDGSPLDPIAPPIAILSVVEHDDISPALRTWRDSTTFSVGLILPGDPTDTPAEAELRALDQVQGIVEAFQDASDAGSFSLRQTPVARLPAPFATTAPETLVGAWLAQIHLVL